jgi:hypothetical protein
VRGAVSMALGTEDASTSGMWRSGIREDLKQRLDALEDSEGKDPRTIPVQEAMTGGITVCFEDQDIREAGRTMQARQVRRLVVLNRDKRLVDIVSLGDLRLAPARSGRLPGPWRLRRSGVRRHHAPVDRMAPRRSRPRTGSGLGGDDRPFDKGWPPHLSRETNPKKG